MCYFLCGKIIREWNTENERKVTGLLGKKEKREKKKEKKFKKENYFEKEWKRMKIMKRVLKKEIKISEWKSKKREEFLHSEKKIKQLNKRFC